MWIHHSASSTLPAGYRAHGSVDLNRDRKQFTAIQVVAVLIVGAMVGPTMLLDLLPASDWSTGLTIAVTLAACLVFGAVDELTHAAVLRLLCDERPTVAVPFPYLVTGGTADLGRRSFAAVALAPAAVLGALLGPPRRPVQKLRAHHLAERVRGELAGLDDVKIQAGLARGIGLVEAFLPFGEDIEAGWQLQGNDWRMAVRVTPGRKQYGRDRSQVAERGLLAERIRPGDIRSVALRPAALRRAHPAAADPRRHPDLRLVLPRLRLPPSEAVGDHNAGSHHRRCRSDPPRSRTPGLLGRLRRLTLRRRFSRIVTRGAGATWWGSLTRAATRTAVCCRSLRSRRRRCRCRCRTRWRWPDGRRKAVDAPRCRRVR